MNKIRNAIFDKINLKFPAFKYKVVKISDTAAGPHNGVSQWRATNTTLWFNFLLLRNSQSETTKNIFHVYGNAAVDSTVGRWVKTAMVSKTGKTVREIPDLLQSAHPFTAVSPEMLQHAEAIICKVQCITTQQLALSLSIIKSPHSRSWIFQGVHWDGLLRDSQWNTDLREMPFLELLASLEAEGPSYPRLLQQMIPGSILHRKQKHNQWNGTIHKLPEE